MVIEELDDEKLRETNAIETGNRNGCEKVNGMLDQWTNELLQSQYFQFLSSNCDRHADMTFSLLNNKMEGLTAQRSSTGLDTNKNS